MTSDISACVFATQQTFEQCERVIAVFTDRINTFRSAHAHGAMELTTNANDTPILLYNICNIHSGSHAIANSILL